MRGRPGRCPSSIIWISGLRVRRRNTVDGAHPNRRAISEMVMHVSINPMTPSLSTLRNRGIVNALSCFLLFSCVYYLVKPQHYSPQRFCN